MSMRDNSLGFEDCRFATHLLNFFILLNCHPCVEVEAESVPADAGGAGLGQVQHGRHGHARVGSVPAGLQDGRAATTEGAI